MKTLILSLLIGLFVTSSVVAQENLAEGFDTGGELNPDEMSLSKSLERASRGDVNMVICSQGYLLVKKGDHKEARKLFLECARQGWTGTMTWMSYMEQNGLGSAENPQASAQWDRQAAELGDPIGLFNHGLDLLRGYGVEQNEKLGRAYIDKAAEQGVKSAQELQADDYNTEVVTPDADSWKFEKHIY